MSMYNRKSVDENRCLRKSSNSIYDARFSTCIVTADVGGFTLGFDRFSLQVVVREPGSIGGQQFIVEECSECDVYLLDHTAALNIDLCTDCRIFTGPCESRYNLIHSECSKREYVISAEANNPLLYIPGPKRETEFRPNTRFGWYWFHFFRAKVQHKVEPKFQSLQDTVSC